MIRVENVSKSFDNITALNDFSLNVKKGSIYGLVGTNGSGKTTIIKHLTGVFIPDGGSITINGKNIYENLAVKEKIGYIPDNLSYYAPYSLNDIEKYYKNIYKLWNHDRFVEMIEKFDLNKNTKINRLSKGMQKQAAFCIIMSCLPEYLILDEPIDGLDPIVRKLLWKYIVEDVASREMTCLISSHNLREMEGICDCIGIVHKGHMVLERDLDELKSDIHKLQVAFKNITDDIENIYSKLNILHREKRGSVDLLIVRNPKETVDALITAYQPVLYDLLPLTLEEIFIYELGGEHGDIAEILF